MPTVVVLGMHGSGTSLVAGLLTAIGVQMHPNPEARVKHYTTYEDAAFMRLNMQILKRAGGNWLKPPQPRRVTSLAREFEPRIKKLVAQRQSELWGWKDPRNCLTAGLYHPHLRDPRYVLVKRNRKSIAKSLMGRGGAQSEQRWMGLSKTYCESAERFLKGIKAPLLRVSYENLLVDREGSVLQIARFVGVSHPDTKKALAVYTK